MRPVRTSIRLLLTMFFIGYLLVGGALVRAAGVVDSNAQHDDQGQARASVACQQPGDAAHFAFRGLTAESTRGESARSLKLLNDWQQRNVADCTSHTIAAEILLLSGSFDSDAASLSLLVQHTQLQV